ncbi:hypothetical protein [Halomonas litopenaei]|uniref:hypothetical protein n=1 Tax=Halomonas litopenaei TaxID=2109328 RepID=UPI001A8FC497|nr:hypothetical protein [Halomonas litopenaei]MBN8411131.1 hypothetical protein [Halomonas litopenaei]
MKLEHLLGKRALGSARIEDYTTWAESLLYDSIETENAAILASIGLERNPEWDDVERYFRKTLGDLGLSLLSDEDALKVYAKYLCETIVSGDCDPEAGVGVLADFYSRSGYDPIYSIWDDLSADLLFLLDEDGAIFNTGLTRDNRSNYIKRVASQFVVLLDSGLPEGFFNLSACPECGYVGKSKLESMHIPWMPDSLFRLIYRRGRMKRPICPRCQRPFPKNMRDYEGRRQFLAQQC